MKERLLDFLFGCTHHRTTFPLSPERKMPDGSKRVQRPYVVCLDCGKEFAYDWDEMSLGEKLPQRIGRTYASPTETTA